jgi:peptide/nickel transport system permease protein
MNKHKLKFPANFYIGAVLLAVVIILVAGAPLFTPYHPLEVNAAERLQGISAEHWFGTDRFGRDVFSRVIYGGRVTIISCFTALLSALAIGLMIGLLTGMHSGSALDIIFMRIIDVLMSFPFLVLAMVVAALFGASLTTLLFVVIAAWWVPFARMTRGLVLQARNETYVSAAEILGAKSSVIMFRELLPQVLGPVLVQATFELGSLILTIAALSFLGMGSKPPAPEWGSMLSDGRDHFMQAPYILLGPSLFIIVTVFALNMIGEGLRDHLDPYEIIEL